MAENILEVKDLKTYFYRKNGIVKAVDGISYEVKKGETLAIVGESGSGKSVGVSSVMGLIQPPGKIISGSATFEGRDLLKMKANDIKEVRGNKISMIFQDPMSSLNPTMSIGEQIIEPLLWHNKSTKQEAKKIAIKLLNEVGIPSPEERFNQYPFEFSGGMRQRVMIAMALICNPDLLIADEPTTALDVTVQAQILSVISDMQKKLDMSVIIITHDLAVASMFSESVIVMYAGRIVERAPMSEFIANPCHPYSKGLLKSTPVIGDKRKQLDAIPGQPPNLMRVPAGCPFAERCANRMEKCFTEVPPVANISDTHSLSCWIYADKGVSKVG
jgi:oligopeptide/dipeptide ABC transporter, ATP-binding protein, C-terminal domain